MNVIMHKVKFGWFNPAINSRNCISFHEYIAMQWFTVWFIKITTQMSSTFSFMVKLKTTFFHHFHFWVKCEIQLRSNNIYVLGLTQLSNSWESGSRMSHSPWEKTHQTQERKVPIMFYMCNFDRFRIHSTFDELRKWLNRVSSNFLALRK